jgi:hypothetical protein
MPVLTASGVHDVMQARISPRTEPRTEPRIEPRTKPNGLHRFTVTLSAYARDLGHR